MKHQRILITLFLLVFLSSCAPAGTNISTPSVSPIPESTITPTVTPSPVPTNTPTIAPTPMGGKNGLLLSFTGATLWKSGEGWRENLDLIYTYDMDSQTNRLLLEGYSCIGTSPDGRKIAMRKIENDKTNLYVMDLAKPGEIVLLYEDVVNTNRWSDYSYWFPGTEWIGFIAKKDGVNQIFVIHPDGSGLTQVTNSSIGAIKLEPVFRDGIFWSEGKENSRGQGTIKNQKWTKLDGTEITIQYPQTVSPEGKYLTRSMKPQNPDCPFCDYELINPATGEIKEVTLVKPTPDNEYPDIQPLSDDKWLVTWLDKSGDGQTKEYWIYSADGKPLFPFANLPHDHDPLPEDENNVDAYSVILKNSSKLPVMFLSPDGNLLLIKHELFTYEVDNKIKYQIKGDVSY